MSDYGEADERLSRRAQGRSAATDVACACALPKQRHVSAARNASVLVLAPGYGDEQVLATRPVETRLRPRTGCQAIGCPRRSEQPLWLPSHRAIAFGDPVVLVDGGAACLGTGGRR